MPNLYFAQLYEAVIIRSRRKMASTGLETIGLRKTNETKKFTEEAGFTGKTIPKQV